MKSQIYAQKYEPHLIFKSVRKITVLPKNERQPLVLPRYVPCLGQDQVVRTSTGEKKGERLMAFTRPPPSQTPPCRALPRLPNVHQFKDPWSLRENMEQILVTDKSNWNQRYTYRVLKTIQMKLILLCV